MCVWVVGCGVVVVGVVVVVCVLCVCLWWVGANVVVVGVCACCGVGAWCCSIVVKCVLSGRVWYIVMYVL